MILEVQITDPLAGTTRKLRFSQSPVRIGRNQLNDLSLDTPFVSEWHGTIRFDGNSVAYFDLGSTNGTLLDGKRLVKNVAAELSEASRLQLGGVELTVAVRRSDSGLNKTLGWGRPDGPAATPAPPSQQPSSPSSSSSPRRPDRSGPAVAGSSPAVAPGARPAPAPIDDERFRAADTPRPSPRAAPPGAADPRAREPMLGRQRLLLEAFAEAFVGLRKGYEQFGAEVGVRTVSGSTALHRARTSGELLDHLLQPNLDPAVASRELIAIFADLGIHHLAMMEAITEAVRAVLQSLDPRASDMDVGSGLLSRGKIKAQWKTYVDRFDQLITDDDELHTAIFGDEFARAYASVTLGDGGPRLKNEDKE
jgi:type VI secretion system protein ImpI